MDYCTNVLSECSSYYKDDLANRIAKMARQCKVQLKSQAFNTSDPTTIFGFILTFGMACNRNRIYEGAAIGLFKVS